MNRFESVFFILALGGATAFATQVVAPVIVRADSKCTPRPNELSHCHYIDEEWCQLALGRGDCEGAKCVACGSADGLPAHRCRKKEGITCKYKKFECGPKAIDVCAEGEWDDEVTCYCLHEGYGDGDCWVTDCDPNDQ